MDIVERKITDLIEAEYNPRQLTKDQRKQLTDSLTRFGLVDPVIVNKHPERLDILVGGHQRCKVWAEMGHVIIPTVEVNLTPDKERELNVRLNKNTGQFDMEMLGDHFDQTDLIDWGFQEWEFPQVADPNIDEFFKENDNSVGSEPEAENTKIVLEYAAEEYQMVIAKFDQMEGTKENIVFELLKL